MNWLIILMIPTCQPLSNHVVFCNTTKTNPFPEDSPMQNLNSEISEIPKSRMRPSKLGNSFSFRNQFNASSTIIENGMTVLSDLNISFSNTRKRTDFMLGQKGYPKNPPAAEYAQLMQYPVTRNHSKMGVFLMGFGAISDTGGWSSAGVIPAIEMAIDDVNNREDILPEYELVVEMRDTKCDSGLAVHCLFQHMMTGPAKIAVLGGGCSVSTVPVARTVPIYGLNQVGYSASSPDLARRDLYPSFFRTAMSELAINKPIVALCLHYDWYHVATIHETEDHFSSTFNQLHLHFTLKNITLVTAESFGIDPHEPLVNIQRKNARIIVFDGYESAAARLFCEVYLLGMYGVKYQWIIPGWYNDKWWLKHVNETGCTAENLLTALNHSFSVIDVKGDLSGEKTISGQSYSEYYNRYRTWPSIAEFGENAYHASGYDAVWALALALHETSYSVSKKSVPVELPNGTLVFRPKTLQDFRYETEFEMSAELWMNLAKVDFLGVSGQVKFNFGERNAIVELKQIIGDQTGERFAVFWEETLELIFFKEPIWACITPPIAWPETITMTLYKNEIVAMCMSSICLVGLLAAVMFLVFNIKNKRHLYIKMSSPNLNNMIVLGCILWFFSVVLLALDSRFVDYETMNEAREWILAIAFTFSFGAMFAKTLRVDRIFRRLAVTNKPVHDRHLLGMVGCLLCLDVFILTLWVVIDPMHVWTHTTAVFESDDAIFVYQNEECTCQYVWYWTGSLLIVKGILLVFGCFLAYETRKVSVPGLNDSKYIGLCVYNVVVMSLLGTTISRLLTDKETVAFSFQAVSIFFCSTTTLSLLFIPKILYVRKHPELTEANRRKSRLEGGSIMVRTGSNTFSYTMKNVSRSMTSLKSSESLTDMDDILSNQSNGLGNILAEKDRQLASLRRQYRTLEQKSEESERKKIALSKSDSDTQTYFSDSAIFTICTEPASDSQQCDPVCLVPTVKNEAGLDI